MNNVYVFVLLLIAIVMTARVVQTYITQEKKRSDSDDDAGEMLEIIERLEERIQVLERIITKKDVDLKQRIDEL